MQPVSAVAVPAAVLSVPAGHTAWLLHVAWFADDVKVPLPQAVHALSLVAVPAVLT